MAGEGSDNGRGNQKRESNKMAETFVLVHGAWHGGWCWVAVINQLERLGDKAFAVDLPGHGMNRADPCPHFSGLFL
jgi:pimeloyl-ACP methyl ester carboxylesterase